MNLLPCGTVKEILADEGTDKDTVHRFLRMCHKAEHDAAGRSFAAIGVLPAGGVWVLAGASRRDLVDTLREANATDAEVMELTTLN